MWRQHPVNSCGRLTTTQYRPAVLKKLLKQIYGFGIQGFSQGRDDDRVILSLSDHKAAASDLAVSGHDIFAADVVFHLGF